MMNSAKGFLLGVVWFFVCLPAAGQQYATGSSFPSLPAGVSPSPSDKRTQAANLDVFLARVNADLPPSVLKKGNDFVLLRIKISECGDYLTHEVEACTHKALLKACERHIRSLKWSPTFWFGVPVDGWVALPIWAGQSDKSAPARG